LLEDCGEPWAEVRAEVDAARAELREFARGMHPATLTERGLQASVGELAGRSPIPVEVAVPAGRFPPAIEAAAYFVCAESLTNVAKHASASQARIRIAHEQGRLAVVVADDGMLRDLEHQPMRYVANKGPELRPSEDEVGRDVEVEEPARGNAASRCGDGDFEGGQLEVDPRMLPALEEVLGQARQRNTQVTSTTFSVFCPPSGSAARKIATRAFIVRRARVGCR